MNFSELEGQWRAYVRRWELWMEDLARDALALREVLREQTNGSDEPENFGGWARRPIEILNTSDGSQKKLAKVHMPVEAFRGEAMFFSVGFVFGGPLAASFVAVPMWVRRRSDSPQFAIAAGPETSDDGPPSNVKWIDGHALTALEVVNHMVDFMAYDPRNPEARRGRLIGFVDTSKPVATL